MTEQISTFLDKIKFNLDLLLKFYNDEKSKLPKNDEAAKLILELERNLKEIWHLIVAYEHKMENTNAQSK
jgi:hypothetical protein